MTTSDPGQAMQKNWRAVLDVIAAIAMIGAAVAVAWHSFLSPNRTAEAAGSAPQVPTEPLSIQGAPAIGSPAARLVMVIFSDFQCPFCVRFAQQTLPLLRSKYVDPGLLRVAFRHLPLPIHESAQRAAEIAQCAMQQDRFWPMHDALFARGGQLDDSLLLAVAKDVNLDVDRFKVCMAGPAPAAEVQSDTKLAAKLGVRATPTFIFGTDDGANGVRASTVLVGARPAAEFTALLNRLLASVKSQ